MSATRPSDPNDRLSTPTIRPETEVGYTRLGAGLRPDIASTDATRDRQLALAARELVDQLAAADRGSHALAEHLAQLEDPAWADTARAARHCHALIADALLLGAVGLAECLGVPDDQLPLEG